MGTRNDGKDIASILSSRHTPAIERSALSIPESFTRRSTSGHRQCTGQYRCCIRVSCYSQQTSVNSREPELNLLLGRLDAVRTVAWDELAVIALFSCVHILTDVLHVSCFPVSMLQFWRYQLTIPTWRAKSPRMVPICQFVDHPYLSEET